MKKPRGRPADPYSAFSYGRTMGVRREVVMRLGGAERLESRMDSSARNLLLYGIGKKRKEPNNE